ncbi:two-component system sensor histidine kinase NtrB [Pseudobdellovibrio exovorus]|uniref:histidine kinase n=1 Tax=Pseudobdellovibrio exovorus JSS TaxID=1184267 RepID=M4VP56_9BACT|nr:ATP-binding protein [Pseudobdellovibrio exovorus]AGH94914.1 hypothetical protein A11Q_694 [Pseudobdellovibrio exovorus JSS]
MSKPDSALLKKYQDSLSNAEMGYWELSLAEEVLKWDDGFKKLFDLKGDDYTGPLKSFLDKVHPEDQDGLKKYVNSVIEGKKDNRHLFRIVLPKNKIKHIRTCVYTNSKLRSKELLIGLSWDVTSEIILQEELSKAQKFTENILNSVPDPIFVKNEKHQWVYTNTEFERLLGKKREELIGKDDMAFFKKEFVEIYWARDQEVLLSNKPNENEEKIIDAWGRTRDILTKKTPLNIGENEKVLVGVIRDITDMKRIQDSLVEQSKMASLGEMAAEIAHEVNNPLMIIQGKAQLLQEKISNPNSDINAFRKDLELIVQNCVRIDKIIKSLKSISRKADLDPPENVSVLGLIDEAFEISKERFRKKRLNLFVVTDEKIDYTYRTRVRPSEVVQVLVNLLNNSYDAVSHQTSGWARINLSIVKEKYRVEVVDSGPEIEPEIINKMMEPFFTTKSTGKGTGLGLSVSKQIIQKYKGDFYFDKKNPNTCFVFTLPKI